MNISIKEFKIISKNQLKGKWKYPVLFTLAYFIFTMFLNSLQNNYFFIGFLAIIIAVGISLLVPKFYLEFIRNEGNISLNNLKINFKQYLKYIVFNVLIGILSMVIIVPIIFFMLMSNVSLIILSILLLLVSIFFTIVSLALVQVPYLIIDTDMSIFKICKSSIIMMKGYKWKYFIMMLSFIGWAILSIFTFGLGFLWLSPYISVTSANFYNQLKKDTLYKI